MPQLAHQHKELDALSKEIKGLQTELSEERERFERFSIQGYLAYKKPPTRGTLHHRRPLVGYPVLVLGAISSFLEPFRGHLTPNVD